MKSAYIVLFALLLAVAGVHAQPCPPGSPIPHPEITSSFLPDSSCQGDKNGAGIPDDRHDCLFACENQYGTYCTFLNAGSTYTWSVTGGTIVGGQGTNCVTVLWGPMGSGTIAVIETSAVGCVGSKERCVKIISSPIAAFTSTTNVCKNVGVNFINQSVGAVSYSWNFGDGNTSTLVNPIHAYATAGTYTVTLVAYNKCGCADSVQKTINVSALAGPTIECPATVCAFAKECYSTSSGCPGAVYNWSVTGGTITGPSNTSSICVQWGAGPQGTISLFITGCGTVCPETTTVVVPIVSSTATIIGPATVCAGASTVYSLPLWPGTYYSWTVTGGTIIAGNNSNSIQVNWPTLPVPANYVINVTWNNILLGCSGSASLIIKVRADFVMQGPPGPFCVGDITTFFANSNANWTVTGGTVISGNGTGSAQIQWTSPGPQTVTATTLTPPLFCNLTASQTVTVIATPPAAAITGPDTICPGGTYMYTATPSGAGYTFLWTVLGGTIVGSPTANPVAVQWSGPGSISVQQVSTTAPFCASAPITLPVTVFSVASITGPSVVCMDGTAIFTAGGANPNLVYTWTIEDGFSNPSPYGSILSGQGTNSISVLWHGPGGSAVVKVTVCGSTLTHPVTINPKPMPTINLSGNVCDPGGSVVLTASGGYASYLWSNAANTQSIVVNASGTYSVTVTDAAGCTGTASIVVPHTPPPIASISTPDQLDYCTPPAPTINVTLYALQGPGYTYLWSPGGQTTPTINVTAAGSYSVTVTGPSGCSRTSNIITVTAGPCSPGSGSCTTTDTIDFATTPPICNPVPFTSLYTAGVSNIAWNFGDPASGGNNTSNLLNPSHTFTQAGWYTVTISGTVTNLSPPPAQCVITRQHSLAIPIAAGFSYVVNCGGVTFTDISTHLPANPIISWNWSFAGGSPSTWGTQTPPQIVFGTPGPHQVILSVSDGTCTVADTQIVNVPPPPSASFTLPATACVGATVPMTASGGTQWSWDFGDAATSAVMSTSHAWAVPGPYTVTLIVTDNNGCSDTTTQSITITPPSGPCSIGPLSPPPICQGDSVVLTASPGGATYQWQLNGVNVGTNSQTYAAMQTGSYTVIITDPNGCVCTAGPVTVIVNPLPPAVITATGSPHICGTGTVTLTAPPGANYTYFWSDSTTNQSITVTLSIPGTYTYWVTVTDTSTGCSSTSANFVINVYPPAAPPTITPSGPTVFCKGGSVTLTSSSAVNNLWNTGATTQSITVYATGVYSVTVTDGNGCSATATIPVTLSTDPDFSLYPIGCDTLCDTVKIPGPIGPYPGYYTYQWLFNGSPIPPANGINDTLTPVGSGTYTLILTGPGPAFCTDTSNAYNLKLHDCDSSHCKGRICGRKWNDLNGNHKFNYGVEHGIPNWKICLVKCNIDGYPTPDTIACTTTDSLGYYCFENLCAGDYCVVEERRAGWNQTWPANPPFYHVTITDSGTVVGLDFGNKFKCIDIWVTKDTIGVPDIDILPFGFVAPACYPWPIVISFQETPGGPFTPVFSGVLTDDINPLPCWPGRYSIRRKHVSNYAFDRAFVNDSLRGDGIDSVVVDLPDSSNGVSVLFLNVPAPDTLKKFRTFTVAQLEAGDQIKPVKRTKPGKPIIMPNTANVIDEMLKQGAVLIAGLPGQLLSGKTVKGYLHPAKQAEVFKTFNMKGGTHTFDPRGLDKDVKGKLIVKRQKSVPATKHNNRFLANLLALKINIAASATGKTPPGFGDLVYVSPSGPSPWFADGGECTVAMIAAKADSILTNWEGVSYQEYRDIDAILASLNEAFAGSVPFGPDDTLKWITDGKLALSGAVALTDVPFLLEVGGSAPSATPAQRPPLNEEPDVFSLEQNYPNPFNPSTNIQFTLATPAIVSLKVYDVLGQEVASLLNREFVEDGSYQYTFDASTLTSGVYFYHLVAEGVPESGEEAPGVFRSVRKMLLVK